MSSGSTVVPSDSTLGYQFVSSPVLDNIRSEIERLNAFFCGWFTGQLPQEAFDSHFLPRFSRNLVFIPPAGKFLGLGDLGSSIISGYAANPHFRIQIRNVVVHQAFNGHILATYEEWQRNALASQPPDNGRIATVLFEVNDGLKWRHIHETWLPPAVMSAGPYDF
jgi:hypothetical protein